MLAPMGVGSCPRLLPAVPCEVVREEATGRWSPVEGAAGSGPLLCHHRQVACHPALISTPVSLGVFVFASQGVPEIVPTDRSYNLPSLSSPGFHTLELGSHVPTQDGILFLSEGPQAGGPMPGRGWSN